MRINLNIPIIEENPIVYKKRGRISFYAERKAAPDARSGGIN